MLLAQAFKEIFLSFLRAGQEAWRRGGRTLQLAVLTVVAGTLVWFATARYRESFSQAPPEWLQPRQMNSPSLPKDAGAEFLKLLDLANRYGKQRGAPLGSVRLAEVRNTNDLVWWTTERFTNAGFDPLRSIERSLRLDPPLFLGYYSSEGKPLAYTIKHSPTRPKDMLLTVHLPSPLAAGAADTLFRLELQTNRVRALKDGRHQVGLGRMPPADGAIHLWAVRLPERARVVRHIPGPGSEVSGNEVVQVAWANARMETSAPPISLIFELPH